MKQEREIKGNEKALIELANWQAELNHAIGEAATYTERAKALAAQADSETLRSQIARQRQAVAVQERAKVFARLGMPSAFKSYAIDHDRGVYSWDADEPVTAPAE